MEVFIKKFSPIVGKILIVGAFLYFGIHSIIDPNTYAGLVPDFVTGIINPILLVVIHGMVEVICALFILFKLGGKWSYYILILVFIGVLFSVSGQTVVRDLAILGGLLILLSEQLKTETP